MTAPPGDIPKLREHVRKTLKSVENELNHAYLHKRLYVETRDEFTAKYPEADHTFLQHYSRLYADRQVMAIRRMVDNSTDRPVSLWWVLERLRKNPGIGNRQDLLSEVAKRYPGDPYQTKEWSDYYDSCFGRDETPAMDALEELQRVLCGESHQIDIVKEYADRNVAHKDHRGDQRSPTYADIHDALTQLVGVFNKVNRLLNWSTTCFCLMVIPPTWRTVFGSSLFAPGASRRDIGPGCGACDVLWIS